MLNQFLLNYLQSIIELQNVDRSSRRVISSTPTTCKHPKLQSQLCIQQVHRQSISVSGTSITFPAAASNFLAQTSLISLFIPKPQEMNTQKYSRQRLFLPFNHARLPFLSTGFGTPVGVRLRCDGSSARALAA